MDHFLYRNGILHAEDVAIPDIAAAVGTPFYVYSAATLTRHYNLFTEALSPLPHMVCFAIKSLSNVAVLKTLGATRARILASFALRSALTGAAAGGVAILAGGLAGWAIMRFVMEAEYSFEPVSALLIVFGGVMATLLAGLAFALRPLAAKPAQVLRAQD